MKNNPPRRTARIWSAVAILGIVIIFIPGIIGLDGFDGGFAMSFIGGLVAAIAIIATVIYLRLGGALDRIISKENVLAHWTYSPDEWHRYIETAHKDDASGRKKLFILVVAISATVVTGLGIYKRDTPWLFVFIFLGIVAITGLTAYLTGLANHRRKKKFPGEAYLSRDGVYLNRQLHAWQCIGSRLEDVVYEDNSSPSPRIRFEYSSPGTYSRNHYTARVPVPTGQEEVARDIVAQIAAAHLDD